MTQDLICEQCTAISYYSFPLSESRRTKIEKTRGKWSL